MLSDVIDVPKLFYEGLGSTLGGLLGNKRLPSLLEHRLRRYLAEDPQHSAIGDKRVSKPQIFLKKDWAVGYGPWMVSTKTRPTAFGPRATTLFHLQNVLKMFEPKIPSQEAPASSHVSVLREGCLAW